MPEETFYSSAGVVSLQRSFISVSGNDAAKFLHNFCTADVLALEPNQACEAFFTDVKGKVIGYAILWRTEQGVTIDLDAGHAPSLMQHLDKYILSEDVELDDLSSAFAEVAVVGPHALSCLQKVGILDPPTTPKTHDSFELQTGNVSALNFPLGDTEAFFVRLAAANVVNVVEELSKVGAKQGKDSQWEAFRIAAGWPKFGVDLTNANLPQEVDRNEQAISFTKGCYLGQETVARLDALGHVNKLLVGIAADSKLKLNAGDELKANDQPVGAFTSIAWSSDLRQTVGLAYVKATHAAAETLLQTEAGDVLVKRFG